MKSDTLTGIDVLRREGVASLRGRRVGLVTNHTGLDGEGRATADLLHGHPDVRLVALFGPEHGIRGAVDEKVPDGTDKATGLPVYSLYGERTKPTPAQLAGLDMLVFDIQDVGCRFYTYISTLGLCMEAADEAGLPFLVLDRPNPLGGIGIEGPMADGDRLSFTAHHRIPVRHGLTVGEMAQLFHAEKAEAGKTHRNAPLLIAHVENWRRGETWDQTGLTWTNPSPNMRSLTQAYLYPGIGLMEFTNLSVGRGTDTPFEVVGAPWIDGRQLAHFLNAQNLPGVRFVPIRFTPSASKHAHQACGGVNIVIVRRDVFHSLQTGFTIACALRDLYPKAWETARYTTLLANSTTYAAFTEGATPTQLIHLCAADVRAFRQRSERYRIYGV